MRLPPRILFSFRRTAARTARPRGSGAGRRGPASAQPSPRLRRVRHSFSGGGTEPGVGRSPTFPCKTKRRSLYLEMGVYEGWSFRSTDGCRLEAGHDAGGHGGAGRGARIDRPLGGRRPFRQPVDLHQPARRAAHIHDSGSDRRHQPLLPGPRHERAQLFQLSPALRGLERHPLGVGRNTTRHEDSTRSSETTMAQIAKAPICRPRESGGAPSACCSIRHCYGSGCRSRRAPDSEVADVDDPLLLRDPLQH